MADDYYKTLGVSRNASQAEIQKAYRDLARKHHPDMNPDDPAATKRFQEIQAAFDILNNPEKREMYDRYGSSFETRGGPQPGRTWTWRQPGPAGEAGPEGFSGEDFDFEQFFGDRFGGETPGGLGDIFAQFRRGGGRTAAGAGRRKGTDITAEVQIPFTTAITGGDVQLGLQREPGHTETIVVKIPAGIEEGKKIRLRGQGEPVGKKGVSGDLLITVHVAPHPFFVRRGNNLYVRLPVTLGEAVAGAKVEVPTPKGVVSLQVPAGTSSGTKLRVKGQGVTPKNGPAGDLFAEVQIVLPPGLGEADREAIRQIDQRHPMNPRQNLRW